MEVGTAYYCASGPSYDDCYFLGQRWNEALPYSSNEGEFWLMSLGARAGIAEGRLYFARPRMMTGVWRSPTRACFVTSPFGAMYQNPDLYAPDVDQRWLEYSLPVGSLMGVWGLDDECVYAWGMTWDAPPVVCRWDGRTWQTLPSPGFRVHSMHGVEPDFVYAVGELGSIARFDGNDWIHFTGPTNETLTSVFVESHDEIYVVGYQGSVLEGSAYGWGKVAEGPRMQTGEGSPLLAVAKWNGDVWIGGGYDGLFRRVPSAYELEQVAPNIHAVSFDVRESLVMATRYGIYGTSDGKQFNVAAELMLRQARDGHDVGV